MLKRFARTVPRIFFLFTMLSASHAANHVVTMQNFAFNPRNITIIAGDSITWSNRDSVLHDTISGTNGVSNGIWASGLLSRGRTFTFTFNNVGGYGYYCTPHWQSFGMMGTVTVLPPPNNAPSVAITNPASGQDFPTGANILVETSASDPDGTVARVEFFTNGISVGVALTPPFSVVLSNVLPGSYTLTAVATDDRGGSSTSSAVIISVAGVPTISLTSPTDGEKFFLGTNIPVIAEVSTPAGVTKVELFANDLTIAQLFSPPFEFNFVPAADADYTLQAVVTDRLGQTNASEEITIRVSAGETIRPAITITNAPRNFARLNTNTIIAQGTATDDRHLEFIEFQVGDGKFHRASGTSNWQATIHLLPGNNIVCVRSVDFDGNVSPVITRFYTFVLRLPLIVEVKGQGSVAPDLSGRRLEVGQLYSLRARPAPQQIFSHWEGVGVVNSNSPLLGFRMESNLVLIANFIPNPFIAGRYTGVFTNADPSPTNSGVFFLRLGSKGRFSGKLIFESERFGFRGNFDALGIGRSVILRRGRSPLAISLVLNLKDALEQITGNVTSGEWSADIFAERDKPVAAP